MTQYFAIPFFFVLFLRAIVILLLGLWLKRCFYAKNASVAYTKINSL